MLLKKIAALGVAAYIIQAAIGAGIGFYTVLVVNGGLDEVAEAWSWLF